MVMNRIYRWLAFALALVVGLLAMWPLRLAPGIAATGLSSASATGSIWAGELTAARWRGLELGELHVGLAPTALLGGHLRLAVEGASLRGAILQGRTNGVESLNGDIPLAGSTPLPIARLGLDSVSIEFAGGVCKKASGQIRFVASGALAAASAGGIFAGTPVCDAGQLLLPLAAGPARMDIRIGGDGRYRAAISVTGSDATERPALLAAGFQPTPQGVALNLEGSL